MDGLLLIDKPVGPTSHDVVARIRRVLRERRIGHTGTLDPAASGVLPLVVGRGTRLARFLTAGRKQYEAVVQLGTSTDTYDAEGAVAGPARLIEMPRPEAIEAALVTFRGTFLQQPPVYSAKKIGGRRSYDIARTSTGRINAAQVDTRPAPVAVTVYQLDLTRIEGSCLTLHVDCSAGFYVRTLAHDLGARLGTGAHVKALRRTHCAGYSLPDTLPLDAAEQSPGAAFDAIIPLARMLTDLAVVVLTDDGRARAAHGQNLGREHLQSGEAPEGDAPIRLLDQAGELIAIGEPAGRPGLLHPSVVLV